MVQVREVMTRPATTIQARAALTEVLRLMEAGGFRHLPVIDTSGALVGILTDRDLAHRATGPMGFLEARERRDALASIEAYEVMTDSPVSVPGDARLRDAARLMLDKRVSCLPVVDDGAVVGILTSTDVLRHIAAG
ncbi:MAG TPA: CBS domain-containing protein [Myxococcota bacterium]|nr:CBS domain-containing protein [Myxococcota bacterium]